MKPALYLPIMILLIVLGWLAYEVEQNAFPYIISLYSISFAAYLLILFNKKKYFFPILLAASIIGRFIMIPSFPLLSDDIYRFYWDAWVYTQGNSPYALLPSEVMQSGLQPDMLAVYKNLNSPDYYSVYPPMLQWIFRLAYWISPSLEGFAIAYKSLVFLSELGSMFFIYMSLKKVSVNTSNLYIYGLNPLIILELSANGHPEAFMITGLSIMIYGMIQIPSLKSWGWAISIGIKLQPLLLAPLLLSYATLKKRVLWVVGGLLISLITLFPIFIETEFIHNLTKSLRLYTQTFEFNGSLYKLFRWLGYQWEGYNTIKTSGPLLSGLAFVSILFLAGYHFSQKRTGLIPLLRFMSLSWLIYLFCSPIVHPWYITPLILFSAFIHLHSIIIWSYLIMLSYVAYYSQQVYEPEWLSFIQYLPVVVLLYFDLYRDNDNFILEKE